MFKKLKSLGFFEYGKVIPGLMIHGKLAPYHVLNERAIRAGSGIMFVLGLFAFFQAFYLKEFIYIKIFVIIFFIDFFTKVIIGTKFSLISNIANLIVKKQAPEYVGAIQKRFAWSIGLVLSSSMIIMLFVFGVQSLPNLIVCGICLTFMFLESSFGICVGCKIYNYLLNKDILTKPVYKPSYPGNVCSIE